jgi:hypothetical protein
LALVDWSARGQYSSKILDPKIELYEKNGYELFLNVELQFGRDHSEEK